jgi:hypothetical protein
MSDLGDKLTRLQHITEQTRDNFLCIETQHIMTYIIAYMASHRH